MGPTPRIVGEDIVFEIGTAYEQGIMTYHPDKGVRPLVRYPGDTTRAAGNVGTDGKHLVWSYRESEPDGKNPVLSVMAAPFTTEAAELAPKRLRSEPYLSLGMAYSVGCGYAGHLTSFNVDDASLLLVRIEDSRSWILKGTGTVWWSHVLGFTCDEVFARIEIRGGDSRLVRIRLDSLGPGLPPD